MALRVTVDHFMRIIRATEKDFGPRLMRSALRKLATACPRQELADIGQTYDYLGDRRHLSRSDQIAWRIFDAAVNLAKVEASPH
jgi:hypothetical protein